MFKQVNTVPSLLLAGLVLGAVALLSTETQAAQSYEGLWVGRAAISYVNEVSIPLDDKNIPIAPDPNVPTHTHDEAYIRLILHVNGAGQVSLLKDVAILKQDPDAPSANALTSESDFVLVTDERLYSDFPEQEAVRIASAVFDFGDRKATDAVDVLVEEIATQVAASVAGAGLTSLTDDPGLRAAEDAAEALASASANQLTNAMDVASTFEQFLTDELSPGVLDTLAAATALDYTTQITYLTNAAQVLADQSFYNDTRAAELVAALDITLTSATNVALKASLAHNLVSRYADVENKYQRFINGRGFGDMIESAAQRAAEFSVMSNATLTSITDGVNGTLEVRNARTEAGLIKSTTYTDTAPTNAVTVVLDAVITSAYTNTSPLEAEIAATAEVAGLAAQQTLPRYALQIQAPTADYNNFIHSTSFQEAIGLAAEAAAVGAVRDAVSDQFHTAESLYRAAKLAAVNALTTVYAAAARARQTELPMFGTFAIGAGDPRLISSIATTNPPLGAAALTTTISLPASHPTNPFRHRRHPDHTTGFDIQREIRLDFDGKSTNQLDRVSIGVDQITGTYREEVFGLHKPLGPDPQTMPIGLKVEGTFELNRISHIDTLNAL